MAAAMCWAVAESAKWCIVVEGRRRRVAGGIKGDVNELAHQGNIFSLHVLTRVGKERQKNSNH